jgi:hypothetical protein
VEAVVRVPLLQEHLHLSAVEQGSSVFTWVSTAAHSIPLCILMNMYRGCPFGAFGAVCLACYAFGACWVVSACCAFIVCCACRACRACFTCLGISIRPPALALWVV